MSNDGFSDLATISTGEYDWFGQGQNDLLNGVGRLTILNNLKIKLAYNFPWIIPSQITVSTMANYAEEVIKNKGIFNSFVQGANDGYMRNIKIITKADVKDPFFFCLVLG